MTVHSMPQPDLQADLPEDPKRRLTGRVKMLLVLLVCAAPVIASYFTYFVIRPEGRTNYSQLILPTQTMPEALKLRTLDGESVTARSLRGQWLLLAVGPSACDDACDKRLFMQRQLREMLGRDRDRLDRVWLITDGQPPAPALRASAEAPPALTMLLADAQAVAAWLQPEGGRALEEHLYIIDPMGEWMMRVPADPDPSRVKRDLTKLLRASGSWDKAGRP
jgi:hypothetical protein